MRKTAFMRWIDGQLAAEPRLGRAVDDLLAEMKLEQQIVALREKRGLTQRQLAKLLGTSQPYVAKLESGRKESRRQDAREVRPGTRCVAVHQD